MDLKKIQARTGYEPMTSAIPVQKFFFQEEVFMVRFLLPLSAIIRQPLYLTVNSLNLEVMCVWSRVVQRRAVVGSSD